MSVVEPATRAGSSYKEEVFRFMHSQPNGIFMDDQVGVVRAIATALAPELPISVVTVSSALALLRSKGRIITEFGHRSLDNSHVITKVTVLAEPKTGSASGPSDPIQQRILLPVEDGEDHVVLSLLRRLINATQRHAPLSSTDLDQFHTHVAHLVEENETWEAIARDAEAANAAVVDELRQQLTATEDALVTTAATVNSRIERVNHEYAQMRERAERYRLDRNELRQRVSELESQVATMTSDHEQASARAGSAIQGLQGRLARQKEEMLPAQKERDEAQKACKQARHINSAILQVSARREQYLITQEIGPAAQLIIIMLFMARSIEAKGSTFHVGNLMESLGLTSETPMFELSSATFDHAIATLCQENGRSTNTSISKYPTDYKVFVHKLLSDLE